MVRDTDELTWPFPLPDSPALAHAYLNLYLASSGDAKIKRQLGDPIALPRPWDPATCTERQLRAEVWMWLDRFVCWFNHEYVWDPAAGMIPACWPQHPHLVHDIAVLAEQRRQAALDLTASRIEEWHRYCVPTFLDRMRLRVKAGCDDHHTAWPAARRHHRHSSPNPVAERTSKFRDDIQTLPTSAPSTVAVVAERPEQPTATPANDPDEASIKSGPPHLRLVFDEKTGEKVDPSTGEIM